MVIFFSILFIVAAVGLVFTTYTRAAQLARLAKLLNVPFDATRENITTDEPIQHLIFFAKPFVHHFSHVFTFSGPLAFTRIADDLISLGKKNNSLTVFSAELKQGNFSPLKIIPTTSFFASSTQAQNNKNPLAPHYTLFSPDSSFTLPAGLVSLLQKHPTLYIETNQNTFIYHEHTLISPEDIQTFRLRAERILQELQTISAPAPKPSVTRPLSATSADQAEAILQALSLPRTQPKKSAPNRLLIGFIVLGLLLAAMALLSSVFVNRLAQ